VRSWDRYHPATQGGEVARTQGGMDMARMAGAIRRTWRLDAVEWAVPARTAAALALFPVGLALIGLLAIPVRPLYRLLVNEDSLGEWLQFALLLALIVLYARLALSLWRSGRRGHAALFAIATAGIVFVTGEEISWGQRIIGWQTPEPLEDVNVQGETTVHNIAGVLALFNLGIMAVCAVAMVLPALRWTVWRDRARGLSGYLFVPPLALLPAFALTFAYRAFRLLLMPEAGYVISRYGELMELGFYFGLAAFAGLSLRAIRTPSREPRPVEVTGEARVRGSS
jgi:hypothetical protein